MKKIIILTLFFSCGFITQNHAQDYLKEGKTVAETLKILKGQWRMMYRIVNDEIFYTKHLRYDETRKKMVMAVDTVGIHTFEMDVNGNTRYRSNVEDATGELIINDWDIDGTWTLKQTDGGIDLHILDAYFKGCPPIIRRIINVNERQLLLQDLTTGDKYYYKRR